MKFVYTAALLLLYTFTPSRSGDVKVVGPSFPLTAAVGQDLVLPCSLQPNISAVDMTVEWLRLDQKDSIVHLYLDHEDRSKAQAVSYRGRTQLFKEELQKGNTSLKLSTVGVSDEGTYKCVVRSRSSYQSWYDDITLDILIQGTGTDPVITVEKLGVSGGISLMCESKGWNPEPEILWLDSEGATLNAEATETERHSEGITVKRRVTVYKTHSNRFYCRVIQEHHMKQTEVIISDDSFIGWWISLILSFLLTSLLLIGIIGLITYVCCRIKGIHRRHILTVCSHVCRTHRVHREIKSNKEHEVDVIMDINTAHPYLNLSENGKHVKYGKKRGDFSDQPEAFDDCVFILGTTGFQHSIYFEVQVKGKTDWTVGVVKKSIRRKGEINLKPEFGFWTLSKGNTMYDPSADVYLRQNLQTVGVFLNYEEGTVSFYDVDANYCVKYFKDQDFLTIDENLYPIFSPGFRCVGKNVAPLIITSQQMSVKMSRRASLQPNKGTGNSLLSRSLSDNAHSEIQQTTNPAEEKMKCCTL